MKITLTATLMALFLCVFTVFGLTACGDKCEHTYFSDCPEGAYHVVRLTPLNPNLLIPLLA